MGAGVEHCINPVPLGQPEAVVEEKLDTRLALTSIEITSDDDWLGPSSLLNRLQHVVRACVTRIPVTGVTVGTATTPVGVEVPEAEAAAHMPQLGPIHIARAPLPPGIEVQGTRGQNCNRARLHRHPIVVVELRGWLVGGPRLNRARAVALLHADCVRRECVLDVVHDAIARGRVLLECIPPIQVVGHHPDRCGPSAGPTPRRGRSWRRAA